MTLGLAATGEAVPDGEGRIGDNGLEFGDGLLPDGGEEKENVQKALLEAEVGGVNFTHSREAYTCTAPAARYSPSTTYRPLTVH